MTYANPTLADVDEVLTENLGHYRTMACQYVAAEGPPDDIYGIHMLALCFREAWGKNVNGDARKTTGEKRAHGVFQINEDYHLPFLRSQPAVAEGTWKPVLVGKTADMDGCCPRFTPALIYSYDIISDNRTIAMRNGVPRKDAVRVALNGFNRGIYGAIDQYLSGHNPDFGTTNNDYGGWCLNVAKLNKIWLDDHPNWRPE